MSGQPAVGSKYLDYAVDILSRLISYPTVSPAGEYYEEAAGFLANELERLGFNVKIERVPAEYQKSNCPLAGESPRFIVYAWRGEGRTLHFNGHYDVVPGGPGWTVTDPFKPKIVEGKLYGRGAVDMKGGIAAVLAAFKAIADSGSWPEGLRIEAAFVPDEEIGGECGTGYVVRAMGVRPDFVLIPEPSGLERYWYGHKGLLWAKVIVEGKTAHGSTPWMGVNAFLGAAEVALALNDILAAMYSTRRSKHKIEPPEAAYPTYMIGGRAGVPGGGKTNQVPGEFEFTIDRRLIPEESVDAVFEEIAAAARMASLRAGVRVRVEKLASMEPAVSKRGLLTETLVHTVERVVGFKPEAVICPGGLDLRYYVQVGAETLSYGPDGRLAHAPDEYIELAELEKLITVFAALPSELAARVRGG